jgi:hypothetical protein
MSRGLGRREREVLESLRLYALHGKDLGLTWWAEGSFNRKHLVMDDRQPPQFRRRLLPPPPCGLHSLCRSPRPALPALAQSLGRCRGSFQ